MNFCNTQEMCPICMDNITEIKNIIVTECGHVFHSSCLLTNAYTNGFGCPCCRNALVEEKEEEQDEEEFDEDDETIENDENEGEDENTEEINVTCEEMTKAFINHGINMNDIVRVLMNENYICQENLDVTEEDEHSDRILTFMEKIITGEIKVEIEEQVNQCKNEELYNSESKISVRPYANIECID